jgi:hypothetical protein
MTKGDVPARLARRDLIITEGSRFMYVGYTQITSLVRPSLVVPLSNLSNQVYLCTATKPSGAWTTTFGQLSKVRFCYPLCPYMYVPCKPYILTWKHLILVLVGTYILVRMYNDRTSKCGRSHVRVATGEKQVSTKCSRFIEYTVPIREGGCQPQKAPSKTMLAAM